MKRCFKITLFMALLLVFTFPSVVSAADLQPAAWSKSGPGTTTITGNIDDSISFYYNIGSGYFGAWEFSSIATSTETFGFKWTYNCLHSWCNAHAKVIAYANGPSGIQEVTLYDEDTYDTINKGGDSSLVLTGGYKYGFKIFGSNSDSSKLIYGTLTIQDIPTVNQAAGQADPTNSSPINYTLVFDKPVTGFTNEDVTLSGTAGATTATVTGSGTTYNIAVSGMTGDGTVIAVVPAGVATDVDSITNLASTSIDNTVIYDTTAPTAPSLFLSTEYWLNADITVTITPGTDALSGVDKTEYRTQLDGGGWSSWTAYTAEFNITDQGQTIIEARTTDNAGNSTSAQKTAKIDKTMVELVPSISLSSENWTNIDITVTITPGTDVDGVDKTEYRTQLSGGTWSAWTQYTAAFNITDEGQTIVEARTTDNIGNAAISTQKTAKIDKTVQASSISLSSEDWTNVDITVTIIPAADILSGLDMTEYRTQLNGGTWSEWTEYTASFNISNEDHTIIEARTTDCAGNTATSQKTAKIDKTVLTPSIFLSSENWTNADVTVTITPGTDALSGVNKTEYRTQLNGGSWSPWTEYTVAFKITDEGQTIIEARTTDNVGNSETSAQKTAKIDKTIPWFDIIGYINWLDLLKPAEPPEPVEVKKETISVSLAQKVINRIKEFKTASIALTVDGNKLIPLGIFEALKNNAASEQVLRIRVYDEDKVLLAQFTFRGKDIVTARSFDPDFTVNENVITLSGLPGAIGVKVAVKIKTELEEGSYDLFKRDVNTGEWEKLRSVSVDKDGFATFTIVNYGEYKLIAHK